MIHLNLKTDKSEKVRRKIEMINKKIELYDRFIGDYTIMRFYKSPNKYHVIIVHILLCI